MADRVFGPALRDWVPPCRPDMARLEGRFVSLEALDAGAHAADLHRANCADDAIWDYLPYGPFTSEAAYSEWVREASGSSDPVFFCDPVQGDRAVQRCGQLFADYAGGGLGRAEYGIAPCGAALWAEL